MPEADVWVPALLGVALAAVFLVFAFRYGREAARELRPRRPVSRPHELAKVIAFEEWIAETMRTSAGGAPRNVEATIVTRTFRPLCSLSHAIYDDPVVTPPSRLAAERAGQAALKADLARTEALALVRQHLALERVYGVQRLNEEQRASIQWGDEPLFADLKRQSPPG
jgi:hypothetical protein